ncbi:MULTISPECIES: antitoxin Xre/MbcA/ParS toxin-binding domain-containing protein [unclassified Pseudomonas]|jgi:putative toxin-antitoxin system antitoxin component (TIGR02293 family)|uniref:antitoxin Xre/MbcA/ParS toxin-binding domain-containing protein n=1 Tax=Pseudomonas sp. A-R-26 TaxID=2832404 RepID=UPI001CBD649B|nr:antitoxin Xre/MbcA/ParS toxin-binding domain-containing protein [Pseudomonas sp. A-R-26]
MFAEVMRNDVYRAYRVRLEMFLPIPTDASDLDIHALIEAGFSPGSIKTLCDLGVFSPDACNHIISLKALKTRLTHGQRLSVAESDRLFRLAHITAMAQTVFGDTHKAQRWLSKSKARFSGENPIALLSTSPGTRLVEELLIEVAEGLAF